MTAQAQGNLIRKQYLVSKSNVRKLEKFVANYQYMGKPLALDLNFEVCFGYSPKTVL